MKFELKEVIAICVVLVGFAAGYGSITWRLAEVEDELDKRNGQTVEIALLKQEMIGMNKTLGEIKEILRTPMDERRNP